MPNSNTPRGLIPSRYLSGGCYNGATNTYFVPASDTTPIFRGALVKLAGGADADGVATITGDIATGDAVLGVVSGVVPVTADSKTHREASTGRYVAVADDPNLVFEIQANGTSVAASAGSVADLTAFTTGDTVNGMSQMQIDTATVTATGDGTQDVLMVGLVQRIDNELGEFSKWLVRLNNHAFVDGSTGA